MRWYIWLKDGDTIYTAPHLTNKAGKYSESQFVV